MKWVNQKRKQYRAAAFPQNSRSSVLLPAFNLMVWSLVCHRTRLVARTYTSVPLEKKWTARKGRAERERIKSAAECCIIHLKKQTKKTCYVGKQDMRMHGNNQENVDRYTLICQVEVLQLLIHSAVVTQCVYPCIA